jgi:serine/arginine repetitive matrix protein 2
VVRQISVGYFDLKGRSTFRSQTIARFIPPETCCYAFGGPRVRCRISAPPPEPNARHNKRPSHAPRRSGDFRLPRWGRSSPGPVAAHTGSLQMSPKHQNEQCANVVTSLQTLNATYGIWWECADLLVELSATGKEDGTTTANHSTVNSAAPSAANTPDCMRYHSSLPVTFTSPALVNVSPSEESSRAMRERAVTLVGPEKPTCGNSKSTQLSVLPYYLPSRPLDETSASRASTTGRHDLNPRQLALLKEMLNTQDPSTFPLPQSPPEPPEPRYNHSHSKSAITLLSIEESGQSRDQSPAPRENADEQDAHRERKRKRLSRRGILGVRDLLLSIKRSREKEAALRQQLKEKEKETPSPVPKLPPLPRLRSSSSDELLPTCGTPHRRRKKISVDPVDPTPAKRQSRTDTPHTPYPDPEKWERTKTIASGPNRLSPRRPSLSALFRLGHPSPRASGGRTLSKSRTRNEETHLVLDAEETGGGTTSSAAATRDGDDEDGEDWDRMELDELERNIPSAVNGYQEDATTRGARSLGPQSGALMSAGLAKGLVNGVALRRRKKDLPSAPSPKTAPTDQSTSSLSLGMASNASKDDGIDSTTKSPTNKLKRSLSGRKAKSSAGSRPQSPLAQVVSLHATGYAQPGAPRSLSRDIAAASASSVNLPQPSQHATLQSPTMQEQLALTPQNLVPLLKYAKEVRTRLNECLEELSCLENEFIGTAPRLWNPKKESGVDITTVEANTDLLGKGYDPDSSLESVEVTAALGRSI